MLFRFLICISGSKDMMGCEEGCKALKWVLTALWAFGDGKGVECEIRKDTLLSARLRDVLIECMMHMETFNIPTQLGDTIVEWIGTLLCRLATGSANVDARRDVLATRRFCEIYIPTGIRYAHSVNAVHWYSASICNIVSGKYNAINRKNVFTTDDLRVLFILLIRRRGRESLECTKYTVGMIGNIMSADVGSKDRRAILFDDEVRELIVQALEQWHPSIGQRFLLRM
eukprot:PhF_6_TR12295/c2_g1_i1/m.19518